MVQHHAVRPVTEFHIALGGGALLLGEMEWIEW